MLRELFQSSKLGKVDKDPDEKGDLSSLLGMPLKLFATKNLTLRLWSGVLDDEIWFVSGEEQVKSLLGQGITRGHIYTGRELLILLGLPGMNGDRLKRVHAAKDLFNGIVQ